MQVLFISVHDLLFLKLYVYVYMFSEEHGGRLAEWKGPESDWTILAWTAFVEVTGRRNFGQVIYALGWDYRSVILKVHDGSNAGKITFAHLKLLVIKMSSSSSFYLPTGHVINQSPGSICYHFLQLFSFCHHIINMSIII